MLPGIRAVAAVLYRLIARIRHLMPGGSSACKVADGVVRDAEGR
jgi:hypothetical protein